MRFGIVLLCLIMATSLAANPRQWAGEWPETDFTQTVISDWSEVISGGPPKDGIPSLQDPVMVPLGQGPDIPGREPVITLELDGAVPRAYPLRYLIWHEIVNDVVNGVPVAVTYCPLCNSGLTFDRRVQGQVLEFGVSGKLRHSDMIMYDRNSQSWWQQATGHGIAGHMTGVKLTALPTWMESLEEFRARNPDGLIMDRPSGTRRDYGRNPYEGYDTLAWPFLYRGTPPPHGIDPLARVVRVGDRAWPMSRLAPAGELRERGLVLTWASGQASALDKARISKGRDVGTIRVRDEDGRDVVHDVMFAFAFHAFWPDGIWETDARARRRD